MERMAVSQAGKAYSKARLKALHTSTIPFSPPVIKYSPSRLSNMHCENKDHHIITTKEYMYVKILWN